MTIQTQNQVGVYPIGGGVTLQSVARTTSFTLSIGSTLDQSITPMTLSLVAGTYLITCCCSLELNTTGQNATVYDLGMSLYLMPSAVEQTNFRAIAASRRDSTTGMRGLGGCASSTGILILGSSSDILMTASVSQVPASLSTFEVTHASMTALKIG
jgi:hypothetical protein